MSLSSSNPLLLQIGISEEKIQQRPEGNSRHEALRHESSHEAQGSG